MFELQKKHSNFSEEDTHEVEYARKESFNLKMSKMDFDNQFEDLDSSLSNIQGAIVENDSQVNSDLVTGFSPIKESSKDCLNQ